MKNINKFLLLCFTFASGVDIDYSQARTASNYKVVKSSNSTTIIFFNSDDGEKYVIKEPTDDGEYLTIVNPPRGGVYLSNLNLSLIANVLYLDIKRTVTVTIASISITNYCDRNNIFLMNYRKCSGTIAALNSLYDYFLVLSPYNRYYEQNIDICRKIYKEFKSTADLETNPIRKNNILSIALAKCQYLNRELLLEGEIAALHIAMANTLQNAYISETNLIKKADFLEDAANHFKKANSEKATVLFKEVARMFKSLASLEPDISEKVFMLGSAANALHETQCYEEEMQVLIKKCALMKDLADLETNLTCKALILQNAYFVFEEINIFKNDEEKIEWTEELTALSTQRDEILQSSAYLSTITSREKLKLLNERVKKCADESIQRQLYEEINALKAQFIEEHKYIADSTMDPMEKVKTLIMFKLFKSEDKEVQKNCRKTAFQFMEQEYNKLLNLGDLETDPMKKTNILEKAFNTLDEFYYVFENDDLLSLKTGYLDLLIKLYGTLKGVADSETNTEKKVDILKRITIFLNQIIINLVVAKDDNYKQIIDWCTNLCAIFEEIADLEVVSNEKFNMYEQAETALNYIVEKCEDCEQKTQCYEKINTLRKKQGEILQSISSSEINANKKNDLLKRALVLQGQDPRILSNLLVIPRLLG